MTGPRFGDSGAAMDDLAQVAQTTSDEVRKLTTTLFEADAVPDKGRYAYAQRQFRFPTEPPAVSEDDLRATRDAVVDNYLRSISSGPRPSIAQVLEPMPFIEQTEPIIDFSLEQSVIRWRIRAEMRVHLGYPSSPPPRLCDDCYLPMRLDVMRDAYYCRYCEGSVIREGLADRTPFRRRLDRLTGMDG